MGCATVVNGVRDGSSTTPAPAHTASPHQASPGRQYTPVTGVNFGSAGGSSGLEE